MTDETAETAPEQTRAMTVSRERLITEAPTAMFDSAAFEHLQRVATVVYRSGFVPHSLTHEGTGNNEVELPEAMVVARCILLADQAQRSGADVVGYIQATSVINGRLMHEGKLVNAIVQRRLGIRLKYRFGLWDTDHITFPELVTDEADPRYGEPKDPTFFHGAGERLAVRAFNPESPDEFVEGSAGQWKTARTGSPWTKVADWPRQLRYRAVREWARAYDPGTVLGMIADGDEEIEHLRDITPKASGVMARLQAGEPSENGFSQENVERETKPRGRKKAADAAPAPEAEAPATPAAETASEAAAEALGGDDLPEGLRPTSPEVPTETDGAPTAESEPDTSASAEPASGDMPAAEEPSQAVQDGEFTEADEITEGYPEADEIYHLNGDEWTLDERRQEYRRDTYKNGEPFSDAGRDKGYAIYEDHRPSTVTADAAITEALVEAEPDYPPDLAAYITAVETANSWAEVKTALGAFQKTQLWAGAPEAVANRYRANTWTEMVEREVEWIPDPKADVSGFRLWMETAPTALQVKQNWEAVQQTDAFKGLSDGARNNIIKAVGARLDYLNGG